MEMIENLTELSIFEYKTMNLIIQINVTSYREDLHFFMHK